MPPEDSIPPYRSAITDALGRAIPDEGPLRVWLDDDVVERAAPEGWVHVITAREACFLLATGRVAELSLDHDIGALEGGGDDPRFGNGHQVIDYLDEQAGVHGRHLWPTEVLQLHTANPAQRDSMARALLTAARRHDIEVLELTPAGTKRRFGFPADERFVAYDGEVGPSVGVNLGDGLGELRFFMDDSVLVRARWDPITDRATGPFDVLTRWGWRRQTVTGQRLITLPPAEAKRMCDKQSRHVDEPTDQAHE